MGHGPRDWRDEEDLKVEYLIRKINNPSVNYAIMEIASAVNAEGLDICMCAAVLSQLQYKVYAR